MHAFKETFKDKEFIIALTGGLVLLGISLVAQFFINGYVTRAMSVPVTDIILSNTRVYDVGGIFVYASVALTLFILLNIPRHMKAFPFAAKSAALFTLIRSIFISLTHISPFPQHAVISSVFFNKEAFSGILTGNDLFFSGHTGLPFLLALIFWDIKFMRYTFLGFSVLFAVVVLLGHLHYSIDVLSAYFITYSIYHICLFVFKKDHRLFWKELLK